MFFTPSNRVFCLSFKGMLANSYTGIDLSARRANRGAFHFLIISNKNFSINRKTSQASSAPEKSFIVNNRAMAPGHKLKISSKISSKKVTVRNTRRRRVFSKNSTR